MSSQLDNPGTVLSPMLFRCISHKSDEPLRLSLPHSLLCREGRAHPASSPPQAAAPEQLLKMPPDSLQKRESAPQGTDSDQRQRMCEPGTHKALLPASWTLRGAASPLDLSAGGGWGASLEDLLCLSGSHEAGATVQCFTSHPSSFSAELPSSPLWRPWGCTSQINFRF